VTVAGLTLRQTAPREIVVDTAHPRPGWTAYALTMTAGPLRARGDAFRLSLDAADISHALAADRIELLVANNRIPARVIDARLLVAGTPCVFTAAAGQWLPDNDFLGFDRGPACARTDRRDRGRLELVIATDRSTVAAVWTLLPADPEAHPPEALRVRASHDGPPIGHALARGRYVQRDAGPAASYGELLGFLWQGPLSDAGLPLFAGVAALLIGGAALAACSTRRLAQCAAAALVAGAVSAAHAVLAPPMHAPDEPSHLFTFSQVVGRPALVQQLDALHLRNHFERIRARPDQRFRAADRFRASEVRWPANVARPVANRVGDVVDHRSPAVGAYWRAIGPLTEGWPVARVLLILRLLNAMCFAVAVGLAAALSGATGAGLAVFAPALLSIPALPFFGMHVSNHALLVSTYVVASGAAIGIVRTARLTPVAGAAAAAALGMGALGGRSALPMLLAWLPLLALRLAPAFARERGTSNPKWAGAVGRPALSPWPPVHPGRLGHPGQGEFARERLMFWLGVGAPACACAALVAPPYPRQIAVALGKQGTDFDVSTAWLAAGALLLALAGLLVETAATRAVAACRDRIAGSLRGLVLALGAVLAVGLGTLLVLPHLTAVEPLTEFSASTRPAPTAYAAHVWAAARGLFGSLPPERLLVWTFWGGFGWLEMPPPLWLISTLSGALGVLLLSWIGIAVWHGHAARVGAVVMLGAGLAAALTLYAMASVWTLDFLHGRYIIGWYLLLMAPAMALVLEACARRPSPGAVVWLVFGIVNAVSVRSILDRYFGA
jgi:hypothetical protein